MNVLDPFAPVPNVLYVERQKVGDVMVIMDDYISVPIFFTPFFLMKYPNRSTKYVTIVDTV
jgi:hypothetical protein